MNKFVFQIVLFLLPFVFVALSFAIYDPFKIIYDHGESIFIENGTPDGFTLNRDYVGTEMFLKKKDSLNYDSFVFGSSRSTVFQSWDWEPYIDNHAVPFHFIGSGESLFGIWSKIMFLDKINHPIKNALLIIDHELLSKTKNGKGVIAIRHPETSGQKINFYITHLIEYTSSDFFIQYLDYKFFGKKRRYMDKLFDNDARGMTFDNYKNDWIHMGKENAIKHDSLAYYKSKKKIFYTRPLTKTYSQQVILLDQKRMLTKIKEIFDKNDTHYKIVINPLYDQKSLNTGDLHYITSTFDAQNVFNYSGITEISSFAGNYYETSHFKPFIAQKILKRIYEN